MKAINHKHNTKHLRKYMLIVEYPNGPRRGTIVEECYDTPGQFVNINLPKQKCYNGPFSMRHWMQLPDTIVTIHA